MITFSVAYILCETSKIVGVLYVHDIYMCMYVPICICTHTYICTHVCFSISHALFLKRYFPFKTEFFNVCDYMQIKWINFVFKSNIYKYNMKLQNMTV